MHNHSSKHKFPRFKIDRKCKHQKGIKDWVTNEPWIEGTIYSNEVLQGYFEHLISYPMQSLNHNSYLIDHGCTYWSLSFLSLSNSITICQCSCDKHVSPMLKDISRPIVSHLQIRNKSNSETIAWPRRQISISLIFWERVI